ncbi:MAG: vitamin B12-dependent ribonucleotide reductase [Candidatus Paceibacterota bacterium]
MSAEKIINKKGLTFKRFNTKEGVNPYDLFNWSKRDVVMKNWRDGSINFQQLGVEFPDHWSDNAISIVTSKYFRGALNSPTREKSLKEVIDRVVHTYQNEGYKNKYFATKKDSEIFADELKYALLDQQFAFNSPVWFNVGTSQDPQISACFILSVKDDMNSILNWYREEGMIFKGGSGAGVNLSSIRSSKEILSSGGNASGPVSFMRGADASAGTIKSGGATRRAAKMVILDVDHPDILEFIRTKADEESKIRALRDAGFDMDLGGKDSISVQYQNANNSVRVNDEFMEKALSNQPFPLRARKDGAVIEEVNANQLLTEIAQAAWECADPGMQYDQAIQSWHTLPNTGRISATNPCSEFVHLDNSSCNLASIRLTRFFNPDTQVFDTQGYRYLVRLMMVAGEISIAFGHFPTEKIKEVTSASRPIGLGYTDLGAMLMSLGVGYDSDLGRAWAAGVTSLLTAESFITSAEMAYALKPFDYFADNKEAMLKVIERHGKAAEGAHANAVKISTEKSQLSKLHDEASQAWLTALSLGHETGYRNSQAVVIAPTGTISFFMDAQTTGIEPDLALVKFKKIADGSSITIVNEQISKALKNLNYPEEAVLNIKKHVLETGSITNAPGFDPTHLPVFACAMGENVVSPLGHLRMMAAVQPFVSGAISKTVNLPQSATVEDIKDIYIQAWKLGLKAVAVYRDNCKVGQPLSIKKNETDNEQTNNSKVNNETNTISPASKPAPQRIRLDRQRSSLTTSFVVGGADGYMTAGTYADGQLGELFLKMSKPGSTLAGVMDAFAISVSIGLQHGVPLETYVEKFINTRFEPAGITNDPDLRIATSVLDYMFRRLALDHLPKEEREYLGIKTNQERAISLSDNYGDKPLITENPSLESSVPLPQPKVELDQNKTLKITQTTPTATTPPQLRELPKHDAPLCFSCGVQMHRAGSCHVCPSCGTTSGCS